MLISVAEALVIC